MASASKAADPRGLVVKALLALAAEKDFGAITLTEIAEKAGISLADLRDLFPSKPAILGGLMRMIDREVLSGSGDDLTGEPAHDRVLDVMMRRFDALGPYREGLKSVWRSLKSDPAAALAFNQAALNSWRYMLEAAGIDTNGALGVLKIQGAALVFARAFDTWLADEPDLARTMALLDRELKRGAGLLQQAEAVHRLAAPFRGLARAVCRRSRDRADDWRRASGRTQPTASEATT